MSYVITDKSNDAVIMYGEQLDYMQNGYPRLVIENVAFPTEIVNVHEVPAIGEEVKAAKYCYTSDKGFYLNPNWVEPKPYTQKQYDAVLISLIEEGRL